MIATANACDTTLALVVHTSSHVLEVPFMEGTARNPSGSKRSTQSVRSYRAMPKRAPCQPHMIRTCENTKSIADTIHHRSLPNSSGAPAYKPMHP